MFVLSLLAIMRVSGMRGWSCADFRIALGKWMNAGD
jgi:hypothetical protein